ncbi:MAG TPA: ABC transporter substrate-binding protein [Gaiellales bacterium]
MPTVLRRSLAVTLVLFAAGCGRGGAVEPSPEPQPAAGGTLTYALTGDPVSVTPLYGGDPSGIVVERNVFAGLVDADPSSLRIVPAIARSWSSSGDRRRWTFRLRTGVTFPAGNGAVTAATFVQDWSLLCSPGVRSPNAAVLAPVAGYAACRRGARTLSGARAAGPSTLVVTLSRPVPDFPAWLADPATWAFPPQLASTPAARVAFERAPVGAGPFRVVRLVHSEHPQGKAPVAGEVVLLRNPGYAGPRPRLARIDMPVVTQADAARSIAAYRAGRYQVLGVPAAAADVVRADPRFDRQLVDVPRLSLVFLRASPGAVPLAGAVDASGVVTQALGKSGQPADGLLPAGMPGYVPGAAHPAARTLAGVRVTLTHVTSPTLAAITAALAQSLRRRGAQVRVVARGMWTVSELDLQSPAPDAALAALAGPLPGPVIAAAGGDRDGALLAAQEAVLARGGIVPLAFGTSELLVAPGVHGLALGALGAPRLASAWRGGA